MKFRYDIVPAVLLSATVVAATVTAAGDNDSAAKAPELKPADIICVNIPGVLPRGEPKVHVITRGGVSVTGYPVAVFKEGVIRLPMIKPIQVNGDSIATVDSKIRDAYKEAGIEIPADATLIQGVFHKEAAE